MLEANIDWDQASLEQTRLGLQGMRDWKLRILPKQPFAAAEECAILARAGVFLDQLQLALDHFEALQASEIDDGR